MECSCCPLNSVPACAFRDTERERSYTLGFLFICLDARFGDHWSGFKKSVSKAGACGWFSRSRINTSVYSAAVLKAEPGIGLSGRLFSFFHTVASERMPRQELAAGCCLWMGKAALWLAGKGQSRLRARSGSFCARRRSLSPHPFPTPDPLPGPSSRSFWPYAPTLLDLLSDTTL